jgi:hypothetical protein
MTTMNDMRMRVTIDAGLLVAGVALIALFVGGAPALLGVLAGGALALFDFWWLAARLDGLGAGASGAAWGAMAGLRLAGVAVAVAALFVTGWFHPVALVVGLSALPCALVVRGLRFAREGA